MNRGSLLHPLNLAQFVMVVSMPFIPAEGAFVRVCPGETAGSCPRQLRAGRQLLCSNQDSSTTSHLHLPYTLLTWPPRLTAVPPEKPAESSSNGRGSSAAPAGAEGNESEEPEDTQAKRRPKGRVHEAESGESPAGLAAGRCGRQQAIGHKWKTKLGTSGAARGKRQKLCPSIAYPSNCTALHHLSCRPPTVCAVKRMVLRFVRKIGGLAATVYALTSLALPPIPRLMVQSEPGGGKHGWP